MDSDKIIEQYLADKNNDVAQTTQSDLKVENVKPLGQGYFILNGKINRLK